MKRAICILSIMSIALMCGMGCLSSEKGTLVFKANGEDFVRQGFTDKQGWAISFDKLFVNLSGITAYNTKDKLETTLPGDHWVDLAAGDENAEPITVGSVQGAPAGNYQSLKFRLKRAVSGNFKGNTIVMIGTAKKDDMVVPFTIALDEEMLFDGSEGYVGDEIKGMLKNKSTADVEMTFHFDHIFGDAEAPADDHINTGSVGFDFFNQFAKDGTVAVHQKEMKDKDAYKTLIHAIWTLGHLGEGHCDVTEASTDL